MLQEREQNAAPRVESNSVEIPSLGSAWDRAVQGFLNVISAVVIGLGYLIPDRDPCACRVAGHGGRASASRSQLNAR